jgi:cell wall-associated NlpC family hydrolase
MTRASARAWCAAALLLIVIPLRGEVAGTGQDLFLTDVPAVEEHMLSAGYWLQRLSDDNLRMAPKAIAAFNANAVKVDDNLFDLAALPDSMAREAVLELIARVSQPSTSPRYFTDGREVGAADYARWQAAIAADRIAATQPVRWGLVVTRASMRSYPTTERVLKHPDDRDLDRFQETAVFPGQRVALLHRSADEQWWFAVNYHYAGWVPTAAVAEGERAQLQAWSEREPRLVVTGARAFTNFNPEEARSSEVPLDMGVSLPLLSPADTGFAVNGQNPYASYIVELPLREADGSLVLSPTLVARSQDVQPGYLPYTPGNVLRQAFKFLGERYGWGNDYNGRDCTGFVGDVYKSLGIIMPRNSGQQGHSAFAPTRFFEPGDRAAIEAALATLAVGDLIYIPGHVMLYIGTVDGEPYVIHDVTGLSYFDAAGELYRGTLSGVSVTPLTPLQLNAQTRFVDSIYAIKSIR